MRSSTLLHFWILLLGCILSGCVLNKDLSDVPSTVTVGSSLILRGTIVDGTYSNSLVQSPLLLWSAGSDSKSLLANYQLAIGTTPGGTDTLNWLDIGLVTTYQATGLTLVDGATYYPSLRLLNEAGNTSTTIAGDGWTVDILAPTPPSSFLDGVMAFSLSKSPLFSWLAGSDNGSGLSSYQVAIGTSSSGTQVLNWTSIGNFLTAALNTLTLTTSKRYYASIRSLDKAGRISSEVFGDGWWNFAQDKVAVDVTSITARKFSNSARFGVSTALSEDELTMVVGAQYDDWDAYGTNFVEDAGAVFVYIQSGGVWVLQQKLVAAGINNRMAGDGFGYSVAISGDTIAVGVALQDYDSSGANFFENAGAVFVFTRSTGVWTQQQKLVASGTNARMAYDYFGGNVSISGNTIATGASGHIHDASGADPKPSAGAAFIFTRSGEVWSQQQKLVATGTNARKISDLFGNVLSVNADTIAIGSPYQDYDQDGTNLITDAGSTFVFTRSAGVWTQQQKLVGTGANGRIVSDNFGSSVSVSGDTIAIGALAQDYDASGANLKASAGAAYVFTRSAGIWVQEQKIVASYTNARVAGDSFGKSISLSADTLAVGAAAQDYDATGGNALTDAGAIYVFTRSSGVWSQQQKIVPTGVNSRIAGDNFGSSLAVSGDTVAVGALLHDYDENGANPITDAGAVFSYARNSGVWSQYTKLVDTTTSANRATLSNNNFGYSTAISNDGLTMVVGAINDNYDANDQNYVPTSGAVYVYIKSAGIWTLEQKLIASGTNARTSGDQFGWSVAISGDTIVAGAIGQDFDHSGSAFTANAGAAYVYTRSAGVWTQQQKIVGSGVNGRVATDLLGYSVAISADTIVVGARQQDFDGSGSASTTNAGAAYVFTRSSGVWTLEQKIIPTGSSARIADDHFGSSVSIDMDSIAIGAAGQGYDAAGANALTEAGAVYIYTRTAGVWTQQQKLVATGTNARMSGDEFGNSVSLSGNTLAVGAKSQDYDATGSASASAAGAVYVYARSSSVWTQEQKLVATGTNARVTNDNFGGSVSLRGDTLAVGAPNQDSDTSGATFAANAGAVYVFTRNSAVWTQQQKLVPTGTNARIDSDNFGFSVSTSENATSDGYTIGIGAPNQGYDTVGGSIIDTAGAIFIYH